MQRVRDVACLGDEHAVVSVNEQRVPFMHG